MSEMRNQNKHIVKTMAYAFEYTHMFQYSNLSYFGSRTRNNENIFSAFSGVMLSQGLSMTTGLYESVCVRRFMRGC